MKKTVREEAMDYLARREHSRRELHRKLSVKGFEDAEIIPALDRLNDQGLQDDERFAASYIRHRANAGFGPLRIRFELQQRGLSEALMDQHLYDGEIDWQERMQVAYQKKYRGEPAADKKEQARRLRFLYGRGFTENLDQVR